MKTRLEHHQGKKKKFWEISVSGDTRTVTAGSIAAKKAPVPKEKQLKSAEAAAQNYEKEVTKKLAAGFFDPTSLASIVADHVGDALVDEAEIESLRKEFLFVSDAYLEVHRTGIFKIWDSQFDEESETFPGSFRDLAYLFSAISAADEIDTDVLDPFFYIIGQLGDGASLVIINQGKWKDRIGVVENPDGIEEFIIDGDIDGTIQGWIDKHWLGITDQEYETFVLERALHRKAAAYDKFVATREATAALEDKIGANPASIEKLILDDLGLRTLPDSLSKCVNLRELSLRENQLAKIPEVIRNLKKLEHLDLYYNPIAEVPDWISELPLVSLDLGISDFQTFPEAVTSICGLESLNLDEVDQIPASIGSLVKLTNLSISGVKGKIAEEGLARCTLLHELNLGQVFHLCEDIGELANLETLIFRVETNMSKPPVRLPESIGDLANLKTLHVGVVILPDSIGNLKSLVNFRYSGNEIPESLSEMISLERLDLHYCKATALPTRIGDLENLKWLNLQSSTIESLPKSFTNLKKLEYLDLRTARRGYGGVTIDFDPFRSSLPNVEVKK